MNGPLSHYVITITPIGDVSSKLYDTTETEFDVDVDCGPDEHNVKEYEVVVVAVNRDHDVELPGEGAVQRVKMCGLPAAGKV